MNKLYTRRKIRLNNKHTLKKKKTVYSSMKERVRVWRDHERSSGHATVEGSAVFRMTPFVVTRGSRVTSSTRSSSMSFEVFHAVNHQV